MDMSLSSYLINLDRPMTEREAKPIFKMIVDGLQYCHQRGVAHLDMKLDNILVNKDGNGQVRDLCISDFGNSASCRDYSTAKEVVGTLHFMAPELFGRPFS